MSEDVRHRQELGAEPFKPGTKKDNNHRNTRPKKNGRPRLGGEGAETLHPTLGSPGQRRESHCYHLPRSKV